MSNEKVLCDRCDHKPVCSLREEYIAAQEAVNNVIVSFDDKNGNEHRTCLKKLRDFKWIQPPTLWCSHFNNKVLSARWNHKNCKGVFAPAVSNETPL